MCHVPDALPIPCAGLAWYVDEIGAMVMTMCVCMYVCMYVCMSVCMCASDEIGAMVIDMGSHHTKVGFSGEDMPKAVFNTVRTRHSNSGGGGACMGMGIMGWARASTTHISCADVCDMNACWHLGCVTIHALEDVMTQCMH